jgi:phosphoribosylformylglycinamidine (FGAM) synthase-like enzyme
LRTSQLFGEPPTVDLAFEKRLVDLLPTLRPVVKVMQDVSTGGLLTTLAEMAFPTALQPSKPVFQGIILDVDAIKAHASSSKRLDQLLLADTHGSVVVACDPDRLSALQSQCKAAAISITVIGKTTQDQALTLSLEGQVQSWPLETLYDIYASTGPLSTPKECSV